MLMKTKFAPNRLDQQFQTCLAIAALVVSSHRASAPGGCDPKNIIAKLKRIYGTVDEIDEQFRPLYAEKDGKHVLDIEIEGMTESRRLEEFRTQHQKDRTEIETLQTKYKDVDVEKYNDLLSREQDLRDDKLIKKGDVDKAVQNKVDAQLNPLKQKLTEAEKREQELRTKLERSLISNQVLNKAAATMQETAGPDIEMRALRIFKLDDKGEVYAVKPDGSPKLNDHGDPYGFDDFIGDLQRGDGKHLFRESAGTGSQSRGGGGGGGGGGGNTRWPLNPWDPKNIDRTLQGKMMVQDFETAQRYAQKFGIKIEKPAATMATIPAGR